MQENNLNLTTSGAVFKYWATLPEKQDFIQDCYYDDVAAASARFSTSEEFQAVLALVKKSGVLSGKVLDLGGGNGVASIAWERAGYDAILLEPDDHPIVGTGAIKPLVASGQSKVKICAAFGEAIPFPDQYFDIVYVRQVLHHITDLAAVHREIYRVLKPSGLYIATREHVVTTHADREVFWSNHPIHQYTGEENAYREDEYVEAMQVAGFTNINVIRRWDSLINYYPTTYKDRTRIAVSFIPSRILRRLTRELFRLWFIQRYLINRLNERDHQPGRMYSFVTQKYRN